MKYKIFKNTKIKTKLIGQIFVVSFFITLIVLFLQTYTQDNFLNAKMEEEIRHTDHRFKDFLKRDFLLLSSNLDVILRNKKLAEIFLSNDRDKLYEFSKPLYKSLKDNYKISHFYFHSIDGINFLRLHNKNLYGDKIKRVTFEHASTSKEIGTGVELGKTAFALRVVKPFYYQGKLIGYIELAKEIDNFLENLVEHSEHFSKVIIIADKEYLSQTDWESLRHESGLSNNWNDRHDHHIAINYFKASEITNKCLSKENIELAEMGPTFFGMFKEKHQYYSCGGFPIIDPNGKSIGGIIVLDDVSQFFKVLNNNKNIFLISSLTLFIIAFLILNYIIHKIVINPLSEIEHVVASIAKGNYEKKVEIHTNDEIGVLSVNLNKMIESLVNAINEAKISREFNLMFESAKNAIFWIDEKTELITRCNKSAEVLTKKTRDEIVGRPFKSLYPEGKADYFFQKFKNHSKSKDLIMEEEIETSAGKIIPVRLSGTIVNIEGRSVIQGIFRDITREKEIDNIKTEFISIASHQLRTPLTAIKWFLELLMNEEITGQLNKEQRKYSKEMFASIEKVIEFVDDLLEVSRIGTGMSVNIKKEKTDIVKVVEHAIKDNISIAEEKKVKIIKICNANKKLEADIDEHRIRQVFHNLINNAIKYSFDGGEIKIYCTISDNKIEFCVRDNGIGIPEIYKKRIFEKLFRAKNAIEIKANGSGLGLYIAKMIVEAHGGKIWFESEENIQTTFYFTLRLNKK